MGGTPLWGVFVVATLGLLFPVFGRSRWSLAARTIMTLVCVTGAIIVAIHRTGFNTPNGPVAMLMLLVFCTLMLGARAGWLLLVVFVGLLAAEAVIFTSLRPTLPFTTDVYHLANWWRVLVVFSVIGGATLWALNYFSRHLLVALSVREQLLARLREESAEREAHFVREQELEAQLRQSHKMDALGRLSSGIAHDFNNLLAVIASGTQLIRNEQNAEQRLLLVGEILAASQRGKELTGQLLTFGRSQTATLDWVDINAVVEQALGMLKRLLPGGVRLHSQLAADVGSFMAHSGQLSQIVMNLALNASDAMPDGGELQVRSWVEHEECAANDKLCLSVSDTGTGMTSRELERLFEPFYTTKSADKGTGLGLSVVHGIVEQQGGRIRVDSTEGVGSCFIVEFPRGKQPNLEEVLARARGASHEPTVLIVEDDPLILRSMKSVLRAGGYKILTSTNGSEALNIWREQAQTVELVITDSLMPELGGRALYEAIAQEKASLPFLFCSGAKSGPDDAEFFAVAHRDFLQKPYRNEQLLSRVRCLLSGTAD